MTFPHGDRQDLLAEVERLVGSLEYGVMSASSYDTAWVARLEHPDDPNRPRYPQAFDWLLAHQNPDGSWGAAIPFAHDRLIATLGVVLALGSTSYRREETEPALRRGVVYLNRGLPDLHDDPAETVGFELILPELVRQARALGLRLPYEQWEFVNAIKADKLRRIPPVAVYGGQTTLTYSLEYLGDRVIPLLIPHCRLPNGSHGASPSATAFAHRLSPSDASVAYLDRVVGIGVDGGVPEANPFELLETAFVLYVLGPYARSAAAFSRAITRLLAAWGPFGIAWTAESNVPDADDTSVAAIVLHENGHPIDASILGLFETQEHFLTYAFERNPSVSANAHVLTALRLLDATAETRRMIVKCVRFITASQMPDGYWTDKWQLSPFYATAEAIAALGGIANDVVRRAVRWLLQEQHENGSWGIDGGNGEETAWAVQALLCAHAADGALSAIVREPIGRAVAVLTDSLGVQDPPPLWIAKTLYAPRLVVRGVILGALLRASDLLAD